MYVSIGSWFDDTKPFALHSTTAVAIITTHLFAPVDFTHGIVALGSSWREQWEWGADQSIGQGKDFHVGPRIDETRHTRARLACIKVRHACMHLYFLVASYLHVLLAHIRSIPIFLFFFFVVTICSHAQYI